MGMTFGDDEDAMTWITAQLPDSGHGEVGHLSRFPGPLTGTERPSWASSDG